VITLYLNRQVGDDARRTSLFDGNIYLYSSFPASITLAELASRLISEAFAGLDPERAQFELPVADFISRVAPLKAEFTNGARSKELCQAFAVELGCDPEETYFDLPRLRVIPAGDYLTSGVSYNYAPHRDMWYGQPQELVNYWAPVFPVVGENAMSIFFDYFDKPVDNASTEYDYDDWVANHRPAAVHQTAGDRRPHPLPRETIDKRSEIRVAGTAGDVMIFSSNHLHASAPNESGVTRFSYDLRTVNLEDLRARRGPRNVDSGATGTTLGDVLRVSDLASLARQTLGVSA
jgi:hypothetical protein